MKGVRTAAAATIVSAIVAAVAYARVLRPWHLRWGATDVERAMPMPLDERIAAPTVASTRVISIDAPAAEIWPWIAQMGERPRAGYYSYTIVERLQGMDVANAERIIPECQELHVGQALDAKGTMLVQAVEPGRFLVLGPPPSVSYLACTWAFLLVPTGGSRTRLITRVRAQFSYRKILRATPWYTWPFWLLLDPGVFVMERKMLLEIKRRAEQEVP